LLGVHSRYGLHTRAVTVYRDPLSEGFSHFVTSIAAPVASGWSLCRVGLAPTGKRRLLTAHAIRGHFRASVSAAFFSAGQNNHGGSATLGGADAAQASFAARRT
jgi:hypothetical protein